MTNSVTLLSQKNNYPIPLVGFGTFRIRGRSVIYNVIDAALQAGYRSIDTAACYHNEEDIGAALKELLPKYNLSREDIYLTTKLFTTDQGKGKASAAAVRSMKALGVKYLDLYLIHWPGASSLPAASPENARLRRESWHDLLTLHRSGLIRHLGVSNYTIKHLEELLNDCGGVRPVVNQVELHPRYPQNELLRFCKDHNILVQAYCSLGGTPTSAHPENSLLEDSIIVKYAKVLQCTPAQLLLVWALKKGCAIIPKSVTPERIRENIQLDFDVPDSIIEQIDSIKIREKYAWDPNVVA